MASTSAPTRRLSPAVAVRDALPLFGGAGLLLVMGASVVLAVDAAAGRSLLVPAGRHAWPGWLAGPLAGLGETITGDGLGVLLVLLLAGWLVVLACASHLSRRTVIAGIVAAHVVFLLAPPLLSADVFGYISFARMGALHHLDPYTVGTLAAPHDAARVFVRWYDARSPYGPLFTLASYATVPLGVAGAFWAFKALAFGGSLAIVALVWRIAAGLGRDPRAAAVLVGLSPATLVFAVAGAHNDLLVGAIAVAGVTLAVRGRAAAGAGTLVAAGALKLSGGIAAPFAIAGAADRSRAVLGAAAAGALVVVAAVVGFGHDAAHALGTAATAGSGIATFSVPSELARVAGLPPVSTTAQHVLLAVAAVGTLLLLARAARGASWITCAGWATLLLLCCTTWLVPWYATWPAPFAALGDSRRLRIATVLFVAYVTLTRVRFAPLA